MLWSSVGSAAAVEKIISQGQVAMEKSNDCNEGYRTLQRVPVSERNNSRWVLSMAKAAECLNQYDESLNFYRKYNRLNPDVPEILKKIAEMNCRLDREAQERYGDHRDDASAGQGKVVGDPCSAASDDQSKKAGITAGVSLSVGRPIYSQLLVPSFHPET